MSVAKGRSVRLGRIVGTDAAFSPFDRRRAMATQSNPEHRTKVRRRHGLWVASCSCAWSEDTVSRFSAWIVSQRHLDHVHRGE